MESITEAAPEAAMMPRFDDVSINLRELICRLAEDVANTLMAAEAKQLCGDTDNSRNGCRERGLETGVAGLSKDQVSALARSLPTRGVVREAVVGQGGALRLARRHLREAQTGPQHDVDRRSHRHRLRRVRLAARARRLRRRHRVARLVVGFFEPRSLLPLAR